MHKTVELSAEAQVDTAESWQEAQAALYDQLGQQLKALRSANGNGQTANGNGRPGPIAKLRGRGYRSHQPSNR